ncbi:ATP-binding protein [bacterium]|nr:ATP-binding protein [bacterium]
MLLFKGDGRKRCQKRLTKKFDILKKETLPNSLTTQLHVPGDPKFLSLIRRILGASAIHLGLPVKILDDIKLAVTEACTNVIKHAFKYDNSKNFSIIIFFSKDFFCGNVSYIDTSFHPDEILPPDLSHIREGGLGVFIMRSIMDEVKYSVDTQTGKIVLKMVKNFVSSQ